MGQNNDTTEHGDLQGNQGGHLARDPDKERRRRQPEEGYARGLEKDDGKLRPAKSPQPHKSS